MGIDVDEADSVCAHLGNLFAGDTLDHDDEETIDRARKMIRAALVEIGSLCQVCCGAKPGHHYSSCDRIATQEPPRE